MKRGAIVTVGSGYAGKPRPAIVIQSEAFADLGSVIVCLLTSDVEGGPATRVAVEPSVTNGLNMRSFAMVDKISAVPSTKVGKQFGHVDPEALRRIDTALILVLGLNGA